MKRWIRAGVRSLPVVIAILLIACGVDSITGPTTVTIGQNVTYDYAWSYKDLTDPATVTNASAELAAIVPAGWAVVSATYDGTVNGSPVSGTATPIASTSCLTAAAGYQEVDFSAGPFASVTKGATGTFHITYTVGGVTGPFTLQGRGSASETTFKNACGNSAVLAITVQAGAALSVSKAFNPATVPTNSPSTLTFTVTNSNAFAASG